MTKYRLTILCQNENRRAQAENVKVSFNCPICAQPLVYLAKEMKLGGHGLTAQTLKHVLQKIEEIPDRV